MMLFCVFSWSKSPTQKFWKFALQTSMFPGRGNGKGPVPTIFHHFWGCTRPPSHSEHQKIFMGSPQNFLKMGPENAHFSHFEPRKRGSEPRFRVSKCAGISRIN